MPAVSQTADKASSASEKRKQTLALRKKAEEAASKVMGKPVSLISKKKQQKKAKKPLNGEVPRKYIMKVSIGFNKKTNEFFIIPKKAKEDGDKKKEKKAKDQEAGSPASTPDQQ
jgi:hypothetical protein